MDNTKSQNKNITDEIVDGLARNYTELEKKYTELEKRQAKTEGLDKKVESLVPKVEAMEVSAANYPKVYLPDYTTDFKELYNQLKVLKEAYIQALDKLEEKINAIPKNIPVKNYHHFEPKAKPVFNLFIAMIAVVTILSGLCIGLGMENNRRTDQTNKFLVLRGFYPDIAKAIDEAYANDASKVIKKAEANIDEQQTMSEAAFAAKQKAEEKATPAKARHPPYRKTSHRKP